MSASSAAVVVAGSITGCGPHAAVWPLIVPVLLMMALSIGSVYRIVRAAIPLLESERYTARMFSLPLTLLIVMAANVLDRLLRERRSRRGIGRWHCSLCVRRDRYRASVRLWRVAVSSGLFGRDLFEAAASAVTSARSCLRESCWRAVSSVATAAVLLVWPTGNRAARAHRCHAATGGVRNQQGVDRKDQPFAFRINDHHRDELRGRDQHGIAPRRWPPAQSSTMPAARHPRRCKPASSPIPPHTARKSPARRPPCAHVRSEGARRGDGVFDHFAVWPPRPRRS